MATIGLFSDSHGDLVAFDGAYELLKARGAKRFVFTGGRFTDLDEWQLWRKDRERGGREYSGTDFLSDVQSFLGTPTADDLARVKERFVRTPERDCLHYRDPSVPRKAIEMLGDVLCCAVHDKNDLDREDLLNSAVFLHGKESEPKVVQIGPRFFVTPGKLTGAAEQTCGLIQEEAAVIRFSAFTLDGKTLIDGQVLPLSTRTKLSVK